MRRLRHHMLGADQGSVILFSDFENGGKMWTGDGSRTIRRKIKFSEPYLSPPVVHVSIAMWDMDRERNQRADIKADKITQKGFDVVFRTWGDSRVARVRADWTALGELPDDEDWDV